MTKQSNRIMAETQVRKSRRWKEDFLVWLCGELEAAGYAPAVEEGFAARNILFYVLYQLVIVLPMFAAIAPLRDGCLRCAAALD